MRRLTFEVYGRFRIHVERTGTGWRAMEVAPDGKRRLLDAAIPSDLPESRIAELLDDLMHELASPGDSVKLVDDDER